MTTRVRGGRRSAGWGARLLACIGALALLAAVAAPVANAAPIDPNWSAPRTVYIPETGQMIDQLFLDLWRSGGGVRSYGNPITPEVSRPDGSIVQYYEYARFEYWPEGDEQGNVVTLGAIGSELRPITLPFRLGNDSQAGRASFRGMARESLAWIPVSRGQSTKAAADEPSYRFVAETKHGVWGGFRAFWEATGEAAYLGNPVTEEYVVGGTSYQVFERGKLRWRPGENVAMEPIGQSLAERYRLDLAPVPQRDIPIYDEALFVPPVAVPALADAPAPPGGGGKSVVVSLGRQAMWAYDGNRVVERSYISTGTEKFRTPTGLYFVNTKIDEQTMEGVLGGEYYNVPNVPYVMYFTDRGHAIHGTYWHNNFGNPMSHGCVNLPMDIAAWIYGWAPVGLPVLIVE